MTTYAPRWEGDTLEQFLLDTECAQFEGDPNGMLEHLRKEHNVGGKVDKRLKSVDQSTWTWLANIHVWAHKQELEALDDPNGLGYRWTFIDDPESFESHLAISMLSGEGRDSSFTQFQGTSSPSQPDIMMRVTLNGVEVDAKAIIEMLDRNFDWLVAKGVAEKARELRFDALAEVVSDMDTRLVAECKSRMRAAGMELPHEDDWR